MSKAKCIMVQGTMSGAGKSLLCAALCRIFAQDGYRVAPFKSQNMALNSFVTRNGAEMGRAQVVQAQAAGVEPDVRMNPILLKPSSDVGSQVIVNGKARGQMPAAAYFKMKRSLIPDILEAYNSLAAENDIIVIEGAGSPAEINLKADDIVNMGLAKLVDAPVLLAGDIDRGGVFAQLYGTVELLEADERARIRGLIINKFRGDVEILRPGLAMLEEKTQLPVLGVVPYLRVEIEDEDSLSDRLDSKKLPSNRWISPSCACRMCPTSPTLSRWNSTRCWACGMCSAPASWVHRISSSCPAPRTPWTTCAGCGKADWKRRCSGFRQPVRRCWACAAAIRCWANSSATRQGRRAAPPAPCGALACCPPRRCSAPKST